jgi:N-acetyl-anhydromuramyl-L-alanine amidase AmpD
VPLPHECGVPGGLDAVLARAVESNSSLDGVRSGGPNGPMISAFMLRFSTRQALRALATLALAAAAAGLAGCATSKLGALAARKGDEIVLAGQFVHTGARVVLWMDPGGYDAYRVERRFSPLERSSWEASRKEVSTLTSPNRYGLRRSGLTDAQVERVRGGGWDLPALQQVVDQFVIHFDACGSSRQCFKVLQDERDLSVHFLLDLDGTIYQTLDLKERAWHATTSNSRSVGIEIANIGAYGPGEKNPFEAWYAKDPSGQIRVTIPPSYGDGGLRAADFIFRPARPEPVQGVIQGREFLQYDFTPEQYQALIKLTATLCKVLPKINCDYPKDAAGELIREKLPDAGLMHYQGILGHFHIQTDKVDPGPAFQWDYVVRNARRLMGGR